MQAGRGWFWLAPSRASRVIGSVPVIAFAAVAHAALPAGSSSAIERCSPTSVLYEIDSRNRAKLEKILDAASRVQNNEAVLWRIEKDGVAPSYLFGTVHVVNESLQDLSPAVRSAIDQSSVVAVESAMTRQGASYEMSQAGPLMASYDKELQRVLADDEIAVVEKALAEAGYPAQMALGLKAWAATMFLADSDCQRAAQTRGLKSVDTLVTDRATAKGLKIVGLESILDQYRSMAAISHAAQIAWLKASIELHHRVDDISQTISELYRFRRLDAVWPLTQEMAPHAGLDDATLETLRGELVDKRNVRLLRSAQPLVEEGGVFIAVGAMHQTGANGLVELLRQQGYRVVAIE